MGVPSAETNGKRVDGMRLVDAHKLYEQYETDMRELVKSTNCENVSLEALSLLCGAKLIADAPTVDAAPVKHGRWEESEEFKGYKGCSSCDNWFIPANDFGGGKWAFCPMCGAKMDLDG